MTPVRGILRGVSARCCGGLPAQANYAPVSILVRSSRYAPQTSLCAMYFVKINRKHRCRRSHAISLSCRANLSLHKHTNLLSNSALVHMVRSFLGALLRPIEEPLAPSRRRVPPWEAYRAPRPLIFYSQCSLYEYAVDDFLAVLLLC